MAFQYTLLAHVQLFVHQDPQVLLHRAALNEFFTQFAFISGIFSTQGQHLAFGLLNLIRFSCAHFLSLSKSLWMASLTFTVSTAPLSFPVSMLFVDNDVEEHGPRTDSWETQLITASTWT